MTELTHAIAGDALAGLQELPLPASVPYTPQTVGWVVVAIVLVALVTLSTWRIIRHRRANAYRRAALAELTLIEQALLHGSAPTLPCPANGGGSSSASSSAATHPPGAKVGVEALPALLKRTAIAATSREHVAALTGPDWLRFLDRTLNTDAFTQGTGRLLTQIAYYDAGQLQTIPRADLQQLMQLSRRWIRHHHADV